MQLLKNDTVKQHENHHSGTWGDADVVNFFLVEAETRRRWDIFQAEVTLY